MKAIIVQIDRQPKIIKLFILITQEIYSLSANSIRVYEENFSHKRNGYDDLLSRICKLEDKVPPSVETKCLPYVLTSDAINLSATSIVLSKDMSI
jgi:hypothetical protein